MNFAIDHCDAFDGKSENLWMKCEHCGRYLFAVDYLKTVWETLGQEEFRVLDAACAEGFGSMMLTQHGFQVIGLDVEQAYLSHAMERCNASFFCVDFDHDSFPADASGMDAVVSFETIEHLDQAEDFLAKLWACLKKEGILLLSFPNAAYEKLDENGNNKDPYHKRIFDPEEMKMILDRAHFEIIEEYGQAICNWMITSTSDAIKENRIPSEEFDALFRYDEKAITLLSHAVAYPRKEYIDDTYSYLWICRKKEC